MGLMCSPNTLGNFSEQSLHNNLLFEHEFCYEHMIKLVVGFKVNFTVNYTCKKVPKFY
jgi:hypothetical protein